MEENNTEQPMENTLTHEPKIEEKADEIMEEKADEITDDGTKDPNDGDINEDMGNMQPEGKPEPAGVLFESIAYQKPEDIPHFIENMKAQDAAFIMISAAKLGHKKNIYSLVESELVSKAIRVLTTPPPNMQQPEGMPQGLKMEPPTQPAPPVDTQPKMEVVRDEPMVDHKPPVTP